MRAAIVAGLGLLVVTGLVFTGIGHFASHYQLRGVFASSNDLLPGSKVRISGVDVGQVDRIARGPHDTSIVSMQIDTKGSRIRADATLAIKPRLAVEGNFYINVDPGTPGAPPLRSGGLVPESHTSVPVQIDQFLDTFDLATRDALQRSIAGFASGLGTGQQTLGATHAPAGYTGLRAAARSLRDALPSIGGLAQAAQGIQPGDLGRAIRFSRDFSAQLAQSPAALAGVIQNMNTMTGSLAAEDQALATSIQQLDLTLRPAPASLSALDSALPQLTSFGNALVPALQAAPGPLRSVGRLIDQLHGLLQPDELPRFVAELHPVTATLPQFEHRLGRLLPLVTAADQCLSAHVVRTLNQKLQDGPNTTGDPAWLDMLHAFTGATSISGGFDGNGTGERIGLAEGSSVISGVYPGIGPIAGRGAAIQGVRPTWLGYGVEPPYRPDQWCYKQPLPNLNTASGPPPSWAKRAASSPVPGVR